MDDPTPGAAHGQTWMGSPEKGYSTLPAGAQQMWQNEYYYLDGTVLGLHDTNSVVQTRHLLKRSISFMFESGSWRGQVQGDQQSYSASGSDCTSVGRRWSPKKLPKNGSVERARTSRLSPIVAGPTVSTPLRSGTSVVRNSTTCVAPSRRCSGSGSLSSATPSPAIVGYWRSVTRTCPITSFKLTGTRSPA